MKHLYLFVCLLLLGGYQSFSQCNGLPSANAFTINGTAASLGNNEFKITNDAKSQAGSIWFSHYLNLDDDFRLEFDVYLGSADAGADGLAFVLQQSPAGVSALSTGGGLGYKGISPSIAVEYDTWSNSNNNDPKSDHIGLMKNGDVKHETFGPMGSPSWMMNMEDGKYHHTIITWDASDKTLNVYWDSDFIATITKEIDLKNEVFSGNPFVYWGWTGSTGDSKNFQKIKLTKVDFTEVLYLNGTVNNATCQGGNGYIHLDVAGGVAPFSYSWSNGTTDKDAFNLRPGVYSVTVKDACGNSGRSTFTVVSEKAALNLHGTISNATCKNSNGYIDLTVEGGLAPFTYLWSNGSSGQDAFNLKPGFYSVEVRDACGNSGKTNFTVAAEKGATSIVCPSDMVVDNTPGKCATDNVLYDQPKLEGCGSSSDFWVKQTGGLPSGSTFPMGTTVNTFVVVTTGGASLSTCKFFVTVQ
jgi:hypothetical protein